MIRRVTGGHSKNLDTPDERVAFPGVDEQWVEIGGFTVGRAVAAPGWRWSRDTQPLVGGDWCQARHVGVVISGRWGAVLQDGRVLEWGLNDVYDCPPGHDCHTIDDEPAVLIEWSGLRTFAQSRLGFAGRTLATLLFTDIVGSTEAAARLGDVGWREVLSAHYAMARSELERYGGREVDTTGDGLFAAFNAPAQALRCAAAIRDAAARGGLHIRAGVHVGEVEAAGARLQGVAVHEAARVMGAAGPGEILVSETTRALAGAVGFEFEDRGTFDLKGLPEPRRLFAFVDRSPRSADPA
jgi:class 3 adenylate cyclase